MRAAISPYQEAGDIVSFSLGGNPYYFGTQRISKQMTLSQSVIIYDFGYCAADDHIILTDIELNKTSADRLKQMQQAATALWYSDGINVFDVKLQQITIKPNNYNKFFATATLCVVEKIT